MYQEQSTGSEPGQLQTNHEVAVNVADNERPVEGNFLTPNQVRHIQSRFGTPVYVYSLERLKQQAQAALAVPHAFGLTVRFAMKASPHGAILRFFDRLGLHIDASSGFEVHRARNAGIPLQKIQLTAQEMPPDLQALVAEGLLFNATSLNQLERFGRLFPGREVSIRINPGLGSGHSQRTNVGGPASSFGIWHEHLEAVHHIQETYDLHITRLHSHIGSGANPAIWQRCAALTLDVARNLPDVHTVNLGGGFKVARMPGDEATDLHVVGAAIADQFRHFQATDPLGRALHLEIEPGTYLVADAGAIISTVIDLKDTGREGYQFIVLNSGMNDLLRPSLYGAQHPITVIPAEPERRGTGTYLVAGHCCESSDILTPAPGDPEGLQPRQLTKPRLGDPVVIGATGAYGVTMAAVNYNSFPRSAVLLLMPDGQVHVIQRRQTLEDVIVGEQFPEWDEFAFMDQ